MIQYRMQISKTKTKTITKKIKTREKTVATNENGIPRKMDIKIKNAGVNIL